MINHTCEKNTNCGKARFLKKSELKKRLQKFNKLEINIVCQKTVQIITELSLRILLIFYKNQEGLIYFIVIY